jgi:S-DNA-T family DNA segregation ATPase FtsK/SpoIIIE
VGSYVVLLSGYLIERASLVGAVLIVLAFDLIVVSLVFAISPIHWTDIVGNLGTRLHERWLDWGVARAERREAREREEAKALKEMAAAEAFAAAEEIRLEKLRRKEEETQRREEEIQRRHAQEEERDRLREEIRLRSETPVTPTPEPGLFDEEFEDDGEEPSDSPGGEGERPNPTVPFEVTEEVIEEEKRFEAEKVREYRYKPPPVSLLNNPPDDEYHVTTEDMETVSRMLEHTLKDFNVDAKVVHVNPGPVITRYDLEPAAGVKVSRIVTLADDLALALRAERIRIIAPVPGKAAVGVEIPNMVRNTVYMKTIVNSEAFVNSKSPLALALGKTSSGEAYVADLCAMPHLLIAGQTGAGKSVCVNSIICSILLRAKPTEVQFVMIDPKMIELSDYKRMARHFLAWMPGLEGEVITDPKDAITVLAACEREMDRRYRYLSETGFRSISEFNEAVDSGEVITMTDGAPAKRMVYLVIIVDELADLMMTAGKDVEISIARLAQKARAVGMHLVVATQRPSVDVLTGMIKANFPSRIAFAVRQKVDSRTIIDAMGADKLLGKGDMLYLATSTPEPVRIHNNFISGKEIRRIIDHIRRQSVDFDKFCLPGEVVSDKSFAMAASERDDLFLEAAEHVIRSQQGSISVLQRRLRIGHSRASRLIDELELAGVVGPFDGSKAREVLVDETWLEQNRPA